MYYILFTSRYVLCCGFYLVLKETYFSDVLLYRDRRIASRSRLAWFKCETFSRKKRKGKKAGKACMVHRHLVLVCPCVEETWQFYRGQLSPSIKWVFKLTAVPLPSQPSPWQASLSLGCSCLCRPHFAVHLLVGV